MPTQDSDTIDITPEPRVLRMLGEIDLPPERCFAEFIDNALDEGIEGKPGRGSKEEGGPLLRVEIETPTYHQYDDNYDNAVVSVRDNGPGMSQGDLEMNLRAGYSGKDPLDEMGLFGMGFNIATARLGNRTTVRSTRAGDDHWSVATIDFQQLEATGTFQLEVTQEEKTDHSDHGTEIIIEQLEEVSRTLRHQNLAKELGDMYTPVLERENVKILFDGSEISSRPHCVWNKERSVEIGGEEFPAYIPVEEKVGEAYYCKACWTWWEDRFVESEEDSEKNPDDSSETEVKSNCPACGDEGNLVFRDQRVYGWVGIQRFLHQNRFGIDLIRNGRVIEKHDKSLFQWKNPDSGEWEKEYPLDQTHWGGRIVGELHIDFVPVTNVKDGFRKENARWEKVRNAVRGEGPFRPTYADDHGFEPNRSPLGKLFKGYRKAKPAGKKRLMPGKIENGELQGDNSGPLQWAEKFWEGDPEYQDDSKWWEAVQLAEEAKRTSEDSDVDSSDTEQSGQSDNTGEDLSESEGFDLDPDSENQGGDSSSTESQEEDSDADKTTVPLRTEVNEDISRKYGLDSIDQPDIEITAKKVIKGDLNDKPVTVDSQTFHKRTIRYDPSHDVFTGFGHQPVEAVLMEVSSTILSRMDDPGDWSQSRLYAELKAKYCADQRITPESLAARATDTLKDIRDSISSEEFELDGFEVPSDIKEETEHNLFKKMRDNSTSLEDILETSAYLEFAPNRELIRYFEAHPEQFFDGVVWDRAYGSMDSAELREQSKDEFTGYLKDARMLAEDALELDLENSHPSNRMELERAAMSLRILESEAV